MPIQEANSILPAGGGTLLIRFGPVPTGREWHIEWVSVYCDTPWPTTFQLVAAPALDQVANSNYIASTVWGNSDYARFDPPIIVQQSYWLFGGWEIPDYTTNGNETALPVVTGSWRIQYSDMPLDERYYVPELAEEP